MHYYVSGRRGNGKCHDSIDGARQEILEDLVSGIKDAVSRKDMWDATALARLVVEACSLESVGSDEVEEQLYFDSDHYWTIQTCTSYTCTDTAKRGSW